MTASNELPKHPNIVLIISDQERATQHFSPGWEQENLPTSPASRQHGMTFNRAFCNACMCSPSPRWLPPDQRGQHPLCASE